MTKIDGEELIKIIKQIDPKEMELSHEDPLIEKWFRFGNYNALQIVCEIIKEMKEKKVS